MQKRREDYKWNKQYIKKEEFLAGIVTVVVIFLILFFFLFSNISPLSPFYNYEGDEGDIGGDSNTYNYDDPDETNPFYKTLQWDTQGQYEYLTETHDNTVLKIGANYNGTLELPELDDETHDVEFTNSSNYNYTSLIDVSAGRARLNPVVASEYNYPYSVASNYTYSETKVLVSGGNAELNTTQGYDVTFDGVNDNVVVPHHSDFDISTTLSVIQWVKAPPAITLSSFGRWNGVGNHRVWIIQTGLSGATDKFRIAMSSNGVSNTKMWESSITAFDDSWRMVAFTYDTGALKLFIDGVYDSTPNKIADGAMTTINTDNIDVVIGRSNTAGGQEFAGEIDDSAIYDATLTDQQILDIFNAGAGSDLRALDSGGDIVSWWRLGDYDEYPTIEDKISGHDGTMTNMDVSDIEQQSSGILYPINKPSIETSNNYSYSTPLDVFTETSTTSVYTGIKHQISDNNGSSYKWWNTTNWINRTDLKTELPDSVTTISGTYVSGNLASITTLDASSYEVDEVAGASSFEVEIEFTDTITTPSDITVFGFYDGNPAHIVDIDMYNYYTSSWITLGQLPDDPTQTITQYDFSVIGENYNYISMFNTIKVRIYHSSNGVPNHGLHIDYVNISGEPTTEWWYDNEANNKTVINDNIGNFTSSGMFKATSFLYSDIGVSTPLLDNIYVAEGTSYSLGEHEIEMINEIEPSAVWNWINITETVVKPTGTNIKYKYSEDNGTTYGSTWLNITALEVELQILTNATKLKFKFQLSTTDPTKTPELDNINIWSNTGYETSGTYTSGMYTSPDHIIYHLFHNLTYDVSTPSGTTATIECRLSDNALDPLNQFVEYDSGVIIDEVAIHFQWRVTFTSTGQYTPVFDKLEARYFSNTIHLI